MKILAIETSCDETAISIVEATGDLERFEFEILGNQLLSQAKRHAEYGGIYPSLAKREHAKNLIPLLKEALRESNFLNESTDDKRLGPNIKNILEREPELYEQFADFVPTVETPDIDAIAVTQGPGLEPALWVGINFAKALSAVWNKPLIPTDHLEGHIISALMKKDDHGSMYSVSDVEFPLLALSIAGGHTQLVLMRGWNRFEVLGETRDDAVGEAFDKVARMLDLPYPGGPEISKLAEYARKLALKSPNPLPRPMLREGYEFSFSGLKTAALYMTKDRDLSNDDKSALAREFEDAVTEVLLKKVVRAIDEYDAKTLLISGGVSANTHIRRTFQEKIETEFPNVTFCVPEQSLTTDNAVMIAAAAYVKSLFENANIGADQIRADGNLRLSGS